MCCVVNPTTFNQAAGRTEVGGKNIRNGWEKLGKLVEESLHSM